MLERRPAPLSPTEAAFQVRAVALAVAMGWRAWQR